MPKKLSILLGFALAALSITTQAANTQEQVQEYLEMSVKGSIPATMLVADAYQHGDGVPQDLARARQYYEMAAKAGDPVAQTILATLYDTAQGGPRNPQKMIYWLRQSAMQNHPDALFMLSEKLKNGDGVAQDTRAAYNLLVRCAIQPVLNGSHLEKTPVACRFFLADNDLRTAAANDHGTRTKALIFLALAFDDPHAADVQHEDTTYVEVLRAARTEYEKDVKALPPEFSQYLQEQLADRSALFARIAQSLETPAILRP